MVTVYVAINFILIDLNEESFTVASKQKKMNKQYTVVKTQVTMFTTRKNRMEWKNAHIHSNFQNSHPAKIRPGSFLIARTTVPYIFGMFFSSSCNTTFQVAFNRRK